MDMRYKRNGFLTFCFSCLPGAGQMFLGFMRRGVSLMALFFGIIGLGSFFQLDLILFAVPIIWFYSFFDAMNKNALSEEELNMMPDHFLWIEDDSLQLFSRQKSRMVIAVGLILIGVYSLLKMAYEYLEEMFDEIPDWLYDAIFYDFPRVVFSLIIIAIGIYLINSHKPEGKEM